MLQDFDRFKVEVSPVEGQVKIGACHLVHGKTSKTDKFTNELHSDVCVDTITSLIVKFRMGS
jgi:hypothetical protein